MKPRLRLVLLAALPAATVALASLVLLSLNSGGEARIGPASLMKMAAGYSRAAEARLAEPEPEVAEAARLSHEALGEFPYDNNSWLRLAYTDTLQHGRLTPEGAEFLRRSYALTAADIFVGVWRIRFVLENSQSVPKDVRAAAKAEFGLLWKDHRQRARLKGLGKTVNNPAGRLSALLWLTNQANGAGI